MAACSIYQSRLVNALVGGWILNTVYTYQTGAPLQWTNGSSTIPAITSISALPWFSTNRMADPGSTAFNTGAFDVVAGEQFNYHCAHSQPPISCHALGRGIKPVGSFSNEALQLHREGLLSSFALRFQRPQPPGSSGAQHESPPIRVRQIHRCTGQRARSIQLGRAPSYSKPAVRGAGPNCPACPSELP